MTTAGSSGSIRRETMCCRLPTSSAAAAIVSIRRVGEPGVPAAPGDREPEEVRRGHEGARHGGDLAELERRPQMAAVDEVDALHHARRDQLARAAGRELLGVLEDEPHLAAGQLAPGQLARRAEQEAGGRPKITAFIREDEWSESGI